MVRTMGRDVTAEATSLTFTVRGIPGEQENNESHKDHDRTARHIHRGERFAGER